MYSSARQSVAGGGQVMHSQTPSNSVREGNSYMLWKDLQNTKAEGIHIGIFTSKEQITKLRAAKQATITLTQRR